MIEKLTKNGGGGQKPTMLVIHAMGQNIDIGQVESDWFKKEKKIDHPVAIYHADEWLERDGTSAHFLIEPNGEIIKTRTTKKIAWHARGFNTNSVGIEVLVEGNWKYGSFKKRIKEDWVTEAQYTALIKMAKGIIDYWGIEEDRVVRHSDLSPVRKVDPGMGFKWEWFKEQLKK